MTEAERKQILAMISDGKITAEEGFDLISSLNEEPDDTTDSADDPDEVLIGEVSSAPDNDDQEIDEKTRAKMERSKGWWDLAAGIGLIIVVVSAYGMYAIQNASGMNFWFFTMFIPLLLGVLLLMLGLPNKNAKWVFVQVDTPDTGKIIVFSFPLSIVRDMLGFGLKFIPAGKNSGLQEFFDILESNEARKAPILVNVDEDGEKVKIFIG